MDNQFKMSASSKQTKTEIICNCLNCIEFQSWGDNEMEKIILLLKNKKYDLASDRIDQVSKKLKFPYLEEILDDEEVKNLILKSNHSRLNKTMKWWTENSQMMAVNYYI
jgi:hypothetical protein